jgi:hypothetical protein
MMLYTVREPRPWYNVTAEHVIAMVLSGETVKVDIVASVQHERDYLHKQILKQTTEPIEIITSPQCDYLVVRKVDMSRIRPFSELEELAKCPDPHQ